MANICEFCSSAIPKRDNHKHANGADSVEVGNNVWTYLYHQNVRESLGSVGSLGNCDGEDNESGNEDEVLKLTFTLSVGERNAGAHNNDIHVKVCKECCEELKRLNELHKEMEEIKKSLERQVRRLNRMRRRSTSEACGNENDDNHQQSSSFSSLKVPPLNMSLAGSLLGRENISQALRFLDSLCQGMSAPRRPRASTSHSGRKNDSIDGTDDFEETVGDHLVGEEELTIKTEVEAEDENLDDDNYPASDFDSDGDGGSGTAEERTGWSSREEIQEKSDQGGKATRVLEKSIESEAGSKLVKEPSLKRAKQNSSSSRHPRKKKPKGKKPCPDCGKLLSADSMSYHMRIHKGDGRTFMCELCSKVFSHKGSLDRHKREHSGVKRFSCEFCGNKFSQVGSLTRHRLTHIEKEPYKCQVCQKGFQYNCSLQNHMKRVHKNETSS